MKDADLRLRPHHIICIQHYAGRGYDDEFTKRINEICEQLQDGSTVVELMSGADDVCGSCPNFVGGRCLSAEKIDRLDENWLRAAGLSVGDRLTWDGDMHCNPPAVWPPGAFPQILRRVRVV